MQALADRGGYFGVYLVQYLVASPTVPTREHVLNHLVHAINVCGADHVGIGSDGGIPKIVLTPEVQAMFDRTMRQRKLAGVAAPRTGAATKAIAADIWRTPHDDHR